MDLTLAKDISLLINGIGVGNSLLLSAMYYCRSYQLNNSTRVLAYLFFILAAIILNTVINLGGYQLHLPGFEFICNALAFSIAPLLLLFYQLETGNRVKINYWHFTATLLFVISFFAGYILPEHHTLSTVLLDGAFWKIIWNLHFFVYLMWLFLSVRGSYRRISGLYWFLILGITSIWMINLSLYLFTFLIKPLPEIILLNSTLFFTLVALWFTGINLNILGRGEGVSRKLPLKTNDQSNLKALADTLVCEIGEKKYYRDPDLDIRSLAAYLGLPYYQLSHVINQEFNKNFNEFINDFRIKEVMNELQSHRLKTYSVMGLAQQAGFRSSSAFYYAFKKTTGTTPTSFMARR